MFGGEGAAEEMKREPALVWYDKTATDDRVWCVRRGDSTVRCRLVAFEAGATDFEAGGFTELQPAGPRGIIRAESVTTFDEVPCG